MHHPFLLSWLTMALVLSAAAVNAAEALRDHTCFQTAAPYAPELDIGSDVAIVYGVNTSFTDRVAQWRAKGYTASMMTGIAWGGYDDYYQTPAGFKKEEVQTNKHGRLFMHGNSTTVGYNVPSDTYIAYIKKLVEPAVDAGVQAIFLEEPEYWAETGWSDGFKKEWEKRYGRPWQAPNSSVDAQYWASKLKYELYFDALRDVFQHIKKRARAQGKTVECHVPTHSLINYAQWRIVSPESHLMDLDAMDGYIAQVWTGTARTPNCYKGVKKERTFETAYLEYGQMLAMVRPTGRKVWFLADPIEDNPNRSWNDYKKNYECTVIASLLWPEVHRFEVMPWPNRIFRGSYPSVDLDDKSGTREGIPAEYATQILIVINALNDMNQPDIERYNGSPGIGVVVSDTMMFQRAAPKPSDPALGSFYALALPLVKNGIPAEIVQLENTLHPNTLEPYQVLLLTYEGQKPLKPEYHEALAHWVRQGGCLLYVGDGSDPYHDVRAWWNDEGRTKAKAYDNLFQRLHLTPKAFGAPEPVGKGYVRVLPEKPRQLQRDAAGADTVLECVRELYALQGGSFEVRRFLGLRRGPYRIYAALDESISEDPLVLRGAFVDLLDPALPCIAEKILAPNERTLLYDLGWARANGCRAKICAAAARVTRENATTNALRFTTRGPKATTARVRLLLPAPPKTIRTVPGVAMEEQWDQESGTLWLEFANRAEDVAFEVLF